MGTHYQSVEMVNTSGGSDWKERDIYFRRVTNPPPADEKVESFRRRLDRAVAKLQLAARTEDEFMKVFNNIIGTGKMSLIIDGGSVDDGQERVERIELNILKIARKRRSAYFLKLLFLGVVVSLFGALLYALTCLIPPYFFSEQQSLREFQSNSSWMVPACLMLPGLSIGIMVVGMSANRFFSYDSIGHMDQYDFFPWERFLWVSLIGYVLFICLWFHAFVLGFGDVDLTKVKENPAYGLLIGLVCGLSEAVVAEIILSHKPK